ncbi:MAG: 4Fe-4S dicluster domain-containing protein [Dehalococcoidia bacterium]|nr:4Fe-4S dicluster domain-containing protein [Dehalococcoidia bacterium]
MSTGDAYAVLAAKHGYGNSVRYRRILEYLMTPEQAHMVHLLPCKAEDLAIQLGTSADAVKGELASMYRKGVIFARSPEHMDEAIFALAVVQLHDITMCSFDVDTVKDRRLFELWDDFCTEEWDPDQVRGWIEGTGPQGRIVPAYRSILDSPEILPCEDMRQIIDSARSIAVAHCTCRLRKDATNLTCKHSHSMVDIQFNVSAEYLVSRNAGKRISAGEAMALVDECEAKGLLHTCENSTRMRPRWGMCNCCVDCCMIYEPLRRFGVPVGKCVAKSRYEARVEAEMCTGCEVCLDWCRFGAINMADTSGSGKPAAVIDPELCMGCGNCVLKCDFEALHMKLVRSPGHIPQAR